MIKVRKLSEVLKRRPKDAAPTRPGGPSSNELCRDRARVWVHAYAAGGAAFAFVPIPVPGSTTAGLVALEATMVHAIARIYGVTLDVKDAAAIVAGLEVAGSALKTIAREAVGWVPGVGWMVRGAIAAGTIEAIGNTVIAMFERRYPGKTCA